MKKLAIVVGHNSSARGAVRVDNKESEYVFNSRLARDLEAMAAAFGLIVKVFFREAGLGYRREIDKVYDEVDRWGADASVELHFNAATPAATGTETLSSGTVNSLRLSREIQKHMVAALGLRDRGIKTRARQDRGGASLHSGKAPACLIEPFFGSNKDDCAVAEKAEESGALARAILKGAAEALDATPRQDLTESRTIKAVERQKTAQVVTGGSGALAGVLAFVDVVRSQLEALPTGGPLDEWTPALVAVLGVISAAGAVYTRGQAGRIEHARRDDHAKALT